MQRRRQAWIYIVLVASAICSACQGPPRFHTHMAISTEGGGGFYYILVLDTETGNAWVHKRYEDGWERLPRLPMDKR